MKPSNKINLRVTHKPELYCGVPTGSTYFTCETVRPADGLGAVLGRGYTEDQAVADFIFRAKQDGATVDRKNLEITERRKFN